MDKTKEARAALAIALGYTIIKTNNKFFIKIMWSGTELLFPCLKKVSQAVGVGAIHALVVHNVAAILDDKETFKMNVDGKIIELPVKFYKNKESEFSYSNGNWRSNIQE